MIRNELNEKLDVVIEGNSKSKISIIFVHGFGTNKDEGTKLFVDISRALKERYRIIRFDFSGYGKSEGKQEDASIVKNAEDLKAVLKYVRSTYDDKLYLIAHSMGNLAVLMLSPDDIAKTIFTGIPNPDTKYQLDNLRSKILSRKGGIVNESGISIYPRTTGELQKVGPVFWQSLKDFDPLVAIKKYSLKANLIVFRPLQDEVISGVGMEEYSKIKSLKYVKLNGDHSFTNHADRENLIKKILDFLD